MADFDIAFKKAKFRLLQMHYESNVGHIGGNLSCLDTLMYLYHKVITDKDRFVLSKGHAAGALYVTLWSLGLLSDSDLKTFHRDGTRLAGHPPANLIKEISFATGSLGHGLPLAVGLALSLRLQKNSGRVYCVTSDGEWNEGSMWEALMFLSHHKLNVTFVVDANGLQGINQTKKVIDLGSLEEKFRTFGLATRHINGHSFSDMEKAFSDTLQGPLAVVAQTKKGNGISYMEDKMEWHYLPMSQAQYTQAITELEQQ